MKIFKIKSLVDNEIKFTQNREFLEEVEIPKGHGLHLEHEVQSKDEQGNLLFDENEQPIMEVVPATCEIIEEEIPLPTYADLRKIQYARRIDPLIAEAITDLHAGDSAKMDALLAEKALIKQEIPKPE